MQHLASATIAATSPSACAAALLDVMPVMMRSIGREMRQRTMPGLSMPQFRALNYLKDHRGASLSAVATHLGLTRPSTSKLIQRLVTQQIIARRVGTDRRMVRLSLTQRGRKALVLARLGTHEQLAHRLQHLSTIELETLAAALILLNRAFSEGGVDVHVL